MAERRPFAARPVAAIAASVLALLLAFAGGYGYHRDELYFVQAGRHPAFGYDDQPPLTPLIGRASAAVFGQTPTGLRVASALALTACVVLAALVARELGGGARAQVVAAASLGASGALFLGHLLSTATFDLAAWTVLLFLAVRLLREPTPGRWIGLGVVTGVALQNKWLVLLAVGSLVAGAVLARRGELLRTRWPWVAGAIALAIWAPNLIWQSEHGWPQQTLSGQIADEDPLGARLGFLPFQLLIVSPLLCPVWIAGLCVAAARPARAAVQGARLRLPRAPRRLPRHRREGVLRGGLVPRAAGRRRRRARRLARPRGPPGGARGRHRPVGGGERADRASPRAGALAGRLARSRRSTRT